MGNLIDHGRKELETAGLFNKDSDYGGMVGEAVMELLDKFSEQGHSGFSASMTISLFEKVARFEPLGPLTGEDSEWTETSDGLYQNKRCSHVFKENGNAYDSQGKIFRERTGATYTSHESRTTVTFPYSPTSEIVDVDEE